MRKLRLIRPWRLHAVRQKATYERQIDSFNDTILVACCGPQGHTINENVRGDHSQQVIATMAAPVSGVIFARGNNPRW